MRIYVIFIHPVIVSNSRGGHLFCVAGKKTAPKNCAGTKMCPKKLDGQNLTL